MNKNRPVLLMPTFPKLSETFIANKFLGLLQLGWDVHIVCASSQAKEWQHFPDLQAARAKKRVHKIWPLLPRCLALILLPAALLRCIAFSPQTTIRYLRQGWKFFGMRVFWQFYQDAEIILLKPNLLHFEFGAPAVGRMYLKDLLGCKIVVSFRGYDLNFTGLDNPAFFEPVWRQADALHLLGKDLWRRAQVRGCPANKAHTLISPAIDSNFFQTVTGERDGDSLGSAQNPLRILSVGRLDWRKGYEYDLQAVKLLVDKGIHCRYRILGDGDYLEAVAFARHQLGLDEMVELLGAQPPQEVRRQMEWADVFLHLAVSEGFCNVLLEAQAMELPVVCSDAGGLPENVAGGESGFIVPRRDPQAAAIKLRLLAEDPELRQQVGQNGRERVLQHFRLEDQISAFEAFYRRALRKGGA